MEYLFYKQFSEEKERQKRMTGKKKKDSVTTCTIKSETQRRKEVAQVSEWPSLNKLPLAEYRAEPRVSALGTYLGNA